MVEFPAFLLMSSQIEVTSFESPVLFLADEDNLFSDAFVDLDGALEERPGLEFMEDEEADDIEILAENCHLVWFNFKSWTGCLNSKERTALLGTE